MMWRVGTAGASGDWWEGVSKPCSQPHSWWGIWDVQWSGQSLIGHLFRSSSCIQSNILHSEIAILLSKNRKQFLLEDSQGRTKEGSKQIHAEVDYGLEAWRVSVSWRLPGAGCSGRGRTETGTLIYHGEAMSVDMLAAAAHWFSVEPDQLLYIYY